MSVYVDNLVWYEKSPLGARAWCHMIADTLDELHAMATQIGLNRAWLQGSPRCPHYDLTAPRRAHAVVAGAIECDRNTFVRHMRHIRGTLAG